MLDALKQNTSRNHAKGKQKNISKTKTSNKASIYTMTARGSMTVKVSARRNANEETERESKQFP